MGLEGFDPRRISSSAVAFVAKSDEFHKRGTEPLGSTIEFFVR